MTDNEGLPPDTSGEPADARVLLLGSRGYLGQQFRAMYPSALVPEVDIADAGAVRQVLREARPDVVINCAGRCGSPNVDWCEDHKTETVRSNVTGPLILQEECERSGAYLVHLSSGCIYSGDNGGIGFSEDDAPNFGGSFYSRTKIWSEQVLREFPVLCLRLRMPFDGSTSDRNLLMKLRKYRRVLTERNSLTYLPDFLRAADSLIRRRATGVWNVVNPGVISPFELMEVYREVVNPEHTFEPLAKEDLSQVTRAGRSNCRLSTRKLTQAGLVLRPVDQAVRQAMQALRRELSQAERVPAVMAGAAGGTGQ